MYPNMREASFSVILWSYGERDKKSLGSCNLFLEFTDSLLSEEGSVHARSPPHAHLEAAHYFPVQECKRHKVSTVSESLATESARFFSKNALTRCKEYPR